MSSEAGQILVQTELQEIEKTLVTTRVIIPKIVVGDKLMRCTSDLRHSRFEQHAIYGFLFTSCVKVRIIQSGDI